MFAAEAVEHCYFGILVNLARAAEWRKTGWALEGIWRKILNTYTWNTIT